MLGITMKLKTFIKYRKKWLIFGLSLLAVILAWEITSAVMANSLKILYREQASKVVYDRRGKLIQIQPNGKGYYDQFITDTPTRVKTLLLKKEDRFFYFHLGVNPFSIVRDIIDWLITGKRNGSSSITQQLVKTLLANENQRSIKIKIKELFYTTALETHASKDEILTMYLNSAYFGKLAQGLKQASFEYFNVPPENLNEAQTLALLSALNNPSQSQAGTVANLKRAKNLAKLFRLNIPDDDFANLQLTKQSQSHNTDASFELSNLNLNCGQTCKLTIDANLTQNIRGILKRNLSLSALDTADNGAVVVIKLPENEILSLVGSPDPSQSSLGRQINMATEARAIGSTAKPFIYLKAFQKGVRPYTLVDDSEIKYQIAGGFDFFPKDFDGQYRGLITLHQALSNSLNIPSVQVLSYVGLPEFYKFLREDLGFKSQQPLENYELGIALGGLEVDPLTLAYYFSLFPQQGWLKPLKIYEQGNRQSPFLPPPNAQGLETPKQVGKQAYVELVNKILNDRDTGVEQFGIKSSLNLPFKNYTLKTGTSRDYHDSWTVGYTPDFLVAVWVGNSNNTPMKQITGLSGAARIWAEIMQVLENSEYNKNTPFNFSEVKEYKIGGSLDYGLEGDDVEKIKQLLLRNNLLLSPHDGDKFLLLKDTTIPLSATSGVSWAINGKFFSRGQTATWRPENAGTYTIEADDGRGKKETVTVYINKQ
jgi:penicillin-binding protein 1C